VADTAELSGQAEGGTAAAVGSRHYYEGAAALQLGAGFFRPESRPSRDLGVLLAALLARGELGLAQPLAVLDLMAGCGVRALRYGLEAGARAVWANDADADRLPVLQRNLTPLGAAGTALEITAQTAQKLLAGCLLEERRFGLLDLDAFGCPTALVPAALEALQFEGVLYLASTDGRSPTGHDRPAAIRSLGAAARAHPASWELALRLQIAVVARAAWAMGRGIRPLFSFSEGRTFRTAVRIERLPARREEEQLGLLAHCHGCGEQLLQPLLRLGRWPACACPGEAPLAVSGPLWIGPLQDPGWVKTMAAEAAGSPQTLSPAAGSLLARLMADPGMPARVWPTALIARQLGQGPPPLRALVAALRAEGHQAEVSGVMAGQLRSDAPWPAVLAAARAGMADETTP